jgi:hypothetical protein
MRHDGRTQTRPADVGCENCLATMRPLIQTPKFGDDPEYIVLECAGCGAIQWRSVTREPR